MIKIIIWICHIIFFSSGTISSTQRISMASTQLFFPFNNTTLRSFHSFSIHFLTCLLNPLQSVFNFITPITKLLLLRTSVSQRQTKLIIYFLIGLLSVLSFKRFICSFLKNNFVLGLCNHILLIFLWFHWLLFLCFSHRMCLLCSISR